MTDSDRGYNQLQYIYIVIFLKTIMNIYKNIIFHPLLIFDLQNQVTQTSWIFILQPCM